MREHKSGLHKNIYKEYYLLSLLDNWERLVEATLDREKLRQLARSQSISSSSSTSTSISTHFSFISPDVNEASRISSETISPTSFGARPIELEEIKKATKSFHSDWLSGGGFGPALKGWIHEDTLTAAKPGFGTAVAVKNWNSDSMQARKEWRAEVNYLSQLHHPNLVKLIGYCSEENNLYLVYEFMPKGSLDKHSFGSRYLLSWDIRIKVALGAARALSFLHEREVQVIYRNFRPAAILLDGDFNAKLWDFSLALEGPTGDMTHVSTERITGTYGYAAPEYLATGRLTTKCDVYAFGVVLLELLAGRRVINDYRVAEERNLVEQAKQYLVEKKKLIQIMDIKMQDQYSIQGAYSVAILALQCLNNDPIRRPKMSEVLVKLEKL